MDVLGKMKNSEKNRPKQGVGNLIRIFGRKHLPYPDGNVEVEELREEEKEDYPEHQPPIPENLPFHPIDKDDKGRKEQDHDPMVIEAQAVDEGKVPASSSSPATGAEAAGTEP